MRLPCNRSFLRLQRSCFLKYVCSTEVGPTPSSGIRSSARPRRPVSYTLPSVHSKLRQGDPFTFGDARAVGKKAPHSRTKPRSRHADRVKGRQGAVTPVLEDTGNDTDAGERV